MKKLNKVLAILCTGAVIASAGAFVGCEPKDEHNHSDHLIWVNDTAANKHYQKCTEDDYKTYPADHDFSGGDCVCGAKKPATVTGVTVSGNTTAKVGETVQLTATVAGSTGVAQTVTWTKVSGEGAVSADGKVTATAPGEVKVKATSTADTSKSGEYTVTFEAVVALALSEDYVCLEDTGDLNQAEVSVTYAGEGTVEATSKNAEVATAAYADGKLTVTAVKAGKAVIEVTDGDKKVELTVDVATAGLTYETLSAEDAEGETYEYVQVSDGEGRTSTDIYIPGYHYQEDANEGEGALLPVTHIKGAATTDEVQFEPNGGAFQSTNVVNVYTGDNVRVIGGRAFESCLSLNEVTCGDNINYIMAYAFNKSTIVKIDLTEKENLNKIGKACFRECLSLTEITIPVNVEGMGDAVCELCPSLSTVRILSTKLNKIWGMSFCEQKGEVDLVLWLPVNVKIIEASAIGSQWTGKNKSVTVYYSGTEEQYNAIEYPKEGDFSFAQDNLNPSESHCTVHYNANFAEMLEAEQQS